MSAMLAPSHGASAGRVFSASCLPSVSAVAKALGKNSRVLTYVDDSARFFGADVVLHTITVPTRHGMTAVQDVVEWQGKLWIALFWINAGQGLMRPSRLVRFDNLPYMPGSGTNYRLRDPLPASIYTGDSEAAEGIEEVANPDLVVPTAMLSGQAGRYSQPPR